MLTSDHGMALYWGAEFATLYNLGSTPIVGAKHPWALGRPYKDVFPEVWAHPVSSHFHYVTDTRKPLLVPDELLIMERHGFWSSATSTPPSSPCCWMTAPPAACCRSSPRPPAGYWASADCAC